MSPIRHRSRFGRRGRGRSPEQDASARAVRARDHLAKQRERERRRLERERDREEIVAARKRLLRIAAPAGFVTALLTGLVFSRPIAERLWLDDVPLERIAVLGTRILSPTSVAAAAGAWAGRPLADVDPEAVAAAIAADPWIARASVLRWPGGALVARVEERRAIARWRVGDRTELVDPRGDRFAGAVEPAATLPLVEGETPEGAALPSAALEILEAIATHRAFTSPATDVRLHLPGAGGYVIQLGDEGPRALLGRRRFAQRVARLATLLEEETDATSSARWIDLRYADRAVLRAEPTSG